VGGGAQARGRRPYAQYKKQARVEKAYQLSQHRAGATGMVVVVAVRRVSREQRREVGAVKRQGRPVYAR